MFLNRDDLKHVPEWAHKVFYFQRAPLDWWNESHGYDFAALCDAAPDVDHPAMVTLLLDSVRHLPQEAQRDALECRERLIYTASAVARQLAQAELTILGVKGWRWTAELREAVERSWLVVERLLRGAAPLRA